jgi:hypothetical protein
VALKASSGARPVASSASISWAMTSVSVSLSNTRPAAFSSAFSSAKFSMMPLWTRVTRPAVWGWALVTLGAPWVAQRTWPMPFWATSGCSASKASRFLILPWARRRSTFPPTTAAIPAES